MDTEIEIIQQWISKSVENLAQELMLEIQNNKTAGKIRFGVRGERENAIIGYISYTPHSDPNEESIEIAINIKMKRNTVSFLADICWSDGEILKEIDSVNLTYNSRSDLLPKLKMSWERIVPNIREKMKSLINLERPPRYRVD